MEMIKKLLTLLEVLTKYGDIVVINVTYITRFF